MTALDTLIQEAKHLPLDQKSSLIKYLSHALIEEQILDLQKRRGMEQIRTALRRGYSF
ncbi:MAG: hypothetical protein RIC30_16150 [Marinoscillum sp.]|uniref:hypothetical protein n=1 Tax=unclassified Marinoscillum TaxID=2624039 RepID=UPI0012F386CD|nr:hypothetical protein [Marinoscillum sp. 108]VXD18543.1 hypothetical protein MARINOS108_20285 [Marinoscillum sp. 108]